MAAATRDAAQQRELIEQQKRLLAERVDRGAADVKELTDWKSRLRKEGPRIAAVGGVVVVLVVGSLVLRKRFKGHRKEAEEAVRSKGDIDALIAELHELRQEMHKNRKGGGGGLGGRIAVAAVSAAASAAGKQAAGKLVNTERQQEQHAA